MPSPSAIITLGLGNGTFNGSPSDLIRFGFGAAEVAEKTVRRVAIEGTSLYRMPNEGTSLNRMTIEGPNE